MEPSPVQIVPLGRGHLERTRAWANDPDIMRLMDRVHTVSPAEHEAWFAALATRTDCLYFGVEATDDGRHVGNVWLWAIDRRHRKAEVRVVIGDPAARGRGLGAAAIDQVCRYGFDRLQLHRLYAFVLVVNPAARRAFERAGFSVEGMLRDDRWAGDRFVDAYLLARMSDG